MGLIPGPSVNLQETKLAGWTWDQWDGFATVPVAARWSTSAWAACRAQA